LSILCCRKLALQYCCSFSRRKAAVKGLNSVLKSLPELGMCHCGRTYFDAIGYSRKGLIVLDVKIKGHQVTAHQNDDNALYKTIPNGWFKNYTFEKISEQLGPLK
jgi:acetylornithine deacetylase